jgi:plasmid stabilization system protein ParE
VKVRLSPDAQRHIRTFSAWWRRNREKNPALFRTEIGKARKLLANAPYAGTSYGTFNGREVYRLNLEGTRRHVYYFVDEAAKIVRIVAVWGSPTKDPPDLSNI